MSKRKIVWDKKAILYFSEAIAYIRKESPQNAEKVKIEILRQVKELANKPELFNPDKYKSANVGNYRAFELHRFRVSYLVKDKEIIIARIRHTSQEPLNY
jgi:plasmid stabilization system protein ParE